MPGLGVDAVPVPILALPIFMTIRSATHSSPVETLRRFMASTALPE